MFVGTIWILIHNRRMQDINRPIPVVAILLLVLSTLVSRIISYIQCHPLRSLKHMILDMVRVGNEFVKYRDTFPGGPVVYFADVTQRLFMAKNFILVFQTLVGDGVLVGSILRSAGLKPSWLTDLYFLDKIPIAVTSFGNLFGFLSYRACSGAAAQLGHLYSGSRML